MMKLVALLHTGDYERAGLNQLRKEVSRLATKRKKTKSRTVSAATKQDYRKRALKAWRTRRKNGN